MGDRKDCPCKKITQLINNYLKIGFPKEACPLWQRVRGTASPDIKYHQTYVKIKQAGDSMSGPKSAEYFLTLEVRMKLAQQRKMKRLTEKINRLSVNIYSYSNTEKFTQNACELMSITSQDGGLSVLLTEFAEVSEKLDNECKSAEVQQNYSDLETVYKNMKALSARKKSIYDRMCEVNEKNIQSIRNFYSDFVHKSMSTDFSGIKSKESKETEEYALKVTQKLNEVSRLDISQKLRTEIQSALKCIENFSNLAELKNFNAVTAESIVKRCREYSEVHEEFDEVFSEYCILCEEYGTKPLQFEVSRESTEQIRKICEELEKSTEKSDEQEYISRNIDEVMTELGYSISGERSVTKKNGTKFHSELFSFGEGTAVNITYSSGGQITMELAGTDNCDRLPDDDERKYLAQEMESFCDSFTEFQKRLSDRGILSKHISVLPPSEEYAQILNTSDYNITGKIPERISTRRNIKGSKKKNAEES